MTTKATSNMIQRRLNDALRLRFGGDLWVQDFDPDERWVVFERTGDESPGTYKLAYTRTGDEYALSDAAPTPVAIETRFVARAVKFVDGSDVEIEGLAIPFGGPFGGKDIDGEDFGPDTDFAFDLFPSGRPVLYDHGTDAAMKTTVQGRQVEHEVRDEGVWAKVQLDKSAKYHATVKRLIDQGLLFFSSGSAPQMAAKNADGHITRWPWLELSLTPTPANTLATFAVKMADLVDHAEAAKVEITPAAIKAALTALDEQATDDDSGSESFDDHVARAVHLAEDVVERAQKRTTLRATKVGRELSTTNRQWLQSLDEQLAALEGVRGQIKEMLAKTDPEAKHATDALLAALEAEMTLARSLGVPIPN